MNLTNFIEPTIIIGVITSIIEILKKAPIVEQNKKWCPTISAVFGIILGVVSGIFYSGETTTPQMVFMGLIYGLSASGLYSFTNQRNKKDGQ